MLVAAVMVPVLAPRATGPAVSMVSAPRVPGDIILSAIIERPAGGRPIAARPAQSVVVSYGDTVESLAASDHSDAAAIRWGNNLSPSAEPSPGTTLLLPPGAGALVQVQPGERPSHFALRIGLDPRVLLDYNALTSDAALRTGSYLQVPVSAAPSGALVGRYFSRTSVGLPSVRADGNGSDGFPYGQCTYFVGTKRAISWAGNAWVWFDHANGIRPEGRIPVIGSIAVFHNGWFGHVAYVEAVNPDGSFIVSEMNYYGNGGGWGRIDHRTIAADDRSVTGFIY